MNFLMIFKRFAFAIFWIFVFSAFLYIPIFLYKPNKNIINVFTWSGSLEGIKISDFEKATGIKVNLTYYDSNEELLVKLKANRAGEYDLIIPSDYAVYNLINEHLLKKIDKTKLNFIKNLNPVFMNHYFDKNNDYSIPFEWAVFVVGYDKTVFSNIDLLDSWSSVFDANKYKVVMTNDALVALPIASLYLFKDFKFFDKQRLHDVKKLLKKQRPFVQAYIDSRPDYFIATKNCPVVVSSSAYILRGMKNYNNIDFFVPKEGSLITIESCVIPASSTKNEQVYKFMNFLYTAESFKNRFESSGMLPTINIDLNLAQALNLNEENFKKLTFFNSNVFDENISMFDVYSLWIGVKG